MTATFTVLSPADGTPVAEVPEHGPEDVAAAAEALRQAQPEWEAMGFAERARWLRKYRDWLLDNETSLAKTLQSETGKPWFEATVEVPYVVEVINYYTKHGARFLADETPRPHNAITMTKRTQVLLRPYPLVGIITPWNFPLALALMDGVPALAAGAAVMVKPSEFTPLVTEAAVAGWAEIGAPPVLACLTGRGPTGAVVVDAVDFVQFTGSTRTGRVIAARAAERLVPVSLELGGKDAMVVLDDADVERAANAAVWGGMCNSGQMCTSVERVYVLEPVYDEFVSRVVATVRKLRQGRDDQNYRYDVGSLANNNQLSIVERHVQDAVAKGATVLAGGKRGASGTFYEPTVLVDVHHGMACMREETFGPVLPIMKVADVDEAVRLANDSGYGLSASVWGKDTARAEQVARRLEAGSVNVNDMFANLFALPVPQAGWKQSGLGYRNWGAAGLRKYCRPQAIVTARVTPAAEPIWYPYSPVKSRLVRKVMRFTMARGLLRRLGLR
ncbi:aldehyde dehydrogenase family protein [Thermocrispum sp.]|jgi:betaine-aldehyde dehydrogenase|uniref:aldehyde dehydrogenase family protein n=1 Tax=Thermocrispum sp. TaxID=2060768 RepID=UPI00257A5A7B|nr:aldehyde dehydrogenase family protein [Thermocrispum sp.]